jgi:hypothetical protein
VSEALQHGYVRSGLFGRPAGPRFAARVVVLGRDDHQAGTGCGGTEFFSEASHGWLGGRSVERKDAAAHGVVVGRRHGAGDVWRHPERLEH